MKTAQVDPAAGLDGSLARDLTQFEPDPEGRGPVEAPSATADGDASDPQWIVWPDAARESDWAAVEFAWTDPPAPRH